MSKTAPKRAKKTTKTRKKTTVVPKDFGIEEAWRYIDRFCRALWVKHMQSDNIRALRNLLVHEDVIFGEHETTIARAAWLIVGAWADKHEREAWRLTLSMCERRAA
jgi:hypothetical protein